MSQFDTTSNKRRFDGLTLVSASAVSDFNPSADAVDSLGSAALRWLNGFFSGTVTTNNILSNTGQNLNIQRAGAASNHGIFLQSGITYMGLDPVVSDNYYRVFSDGNHGAAMNLGNPGKWIAYSNSGTMLYSAKTTASNFIYTDEVNSKALLTLVVNTGISTPQAAITNTSSQIVFGTTNTTTFSVSAPTSSRTITFQDPGAAAIAIYDVLAQTISGVKTFSNGLLTNLINTNGNNDMTIQRNGTTLITLQSGVIAFSTSADVTQKRYYREDHTNIGQSVTNNTATTVVFNTVDVNNNGPTYSATEYTPTKAGWWLITYQVSFAANATGSRVAWINKNEDTTNRYAPHEVPNGGAGDLVMLSGSWKMQFNGTTDLFSIVVLQNSGGTLTIGATDPSNATNRVSMTFLHE